MRGISAGLACAALALIGAAALDAKPRCDGKGRCVALPQRTVPVALAGLLTASERPTFSDRVRFPTPTEMFGPDGPAAYQAIDAALLGFARPPATARAAASSSGTTGSIGWVADGDTAQTGGTGDGPMTDTGGFTDTATDTDRSQSAARQTSWRARLKRPCPTASGFVHGTAEGATSKRITIDEGRGKTRTIKVNYSVEGELTGLVGSNARLSLTALNLDVVVSATATSGAWRGDALVRWGDRFSSVEFTGEDARSLAGDNAARVLVGLIAAAGDRLLVRAERIWRTPNRCAKLRLTAQPTRISAGRQAKVRAHLKAADGGDVDLGRVHGTAVGARVAPASVQPDDHGIARFTVTATTDAAALSTRAVSPAGIAAETITLGKVGSFTATLEAVRTDSWTSHTRNYYPNGDPAFCDLDGNGTELIKTPPEKFVRSAVYYHDGDGLVLDFLGYLVLNRNGTFTDSCSTSNDRSECGADWTYETLTPFAIVNQGDFVQLKMDGGLTNRPRIACPGFVGQQCNGPEPELINTPARLPRAALQDPKQKTITLEGSTSWTLEETCSGASGSSTTNHDDVKFEWTITLLRQ